MRLNDLITFPEGKEITKDDLDFEGYTKPSGDRKEGFNYCLSEIRKLNEGVELVVDEDKMARELHHLSGNIIPYDELLLLSKGNVKVYLNKAKSIAQSLDKWLKVKE